MIYNIVPVPKPRMTQKDKRRKDKRPRPCVARYWAFVKEVQYKMKGVDLERSTIHFFFRMPNSWSVAKKARMLGEPHRQKPDIDNLWKALADALNKDDSHIAKMQASKSWANRSCILVDLP